MDAQLRPDGMAEVFLKCGRCGECFEVTPLMFGCFICACSGALSVLEVRVLAAACCGAAEMGCPQIPLGSSQWQNTVAGAKRRVGVCLLSG